MLKKVKRRYLAVVIESQALCSSSEFVDSVWASLGSLFGEYGCSTVSLSLVKFNDQNRTAVIRTDHVSLDKVRVALASIMRINREPSAVQVLRISGTLKGLGNSYEQL